MGKKKIVKVKNKAPAEIQITAEQLLREAKERDLEIVPHPPKQKISDPEELADYQRRKRRTFEDDIRKNRGNISNWLKYARWEENQKEIQRARSIYERALDVDHRNVNLWIKYSQWEMNNQQVNHARNIYDRAVTILPRANQIWYKYVYMEETLGNMAGTRQVFDRWMQWRPDEQAWMTYVNFEMRYKEINRAREIFNTFIIVHPVVENWIKFARFQENHGFISEAREVYYRAYQFFGEDLMDEEFFVAFATFEENYKEYERARVIYKYALERLPEEKAQNLNNAYSIYEKKFGDKDTIENVISGKRKFLYEQEIKQNPMNYDAWFDYLEIVESEGNFEVIRDSYEKAIANVPPVKGKQFWRRYIYLWINYAIFEELTARNSERTRKVYLACLEIIPHKKFTFAKMWLYYASFEVRQKKLPAARKALGKAIGLCPKKKLFKGYIELELQLQAVNRCRKLYEKFLDFNAENCSTWVQFAELETYLDEIDRARVIYEEAVKQSHLDMPDLLWKSFIDFEISQNELENARKVFERANNSLKNVGEKEEKAKLLQSWKLFEKEFGNEETLERVDVIMPNRVKKRVHFVSDDGKEEGWEEKLVLVFPEDETANAKQNMKILTQSKSWAKQVDEFDF
ncbi:crooked neck-like protein 1 [Planococcus citri]|uniref:crooked neck-like protein 1 n=1 Tax=Planococcus citri TaxID=170843 RepID=UPI0031F79ACC